MPRLLSSNDVTHFRDRLCQAAERLFATSGPSSVTMRQLAVELACSPMTPYRYFKDKDEILATVRTAAFNRLADRLEAALEGAHKRDFRTLCQAVSGEQVAFVRAEPNAYRLMFDLMQPEEAAYPDEQVASARVREVLTVSIASAAQGPFDAEAATRAGEALWAALHGAVMLHLADKLPSETSLETFVEGLVDQICHDAVGGRTRICDA